MNNDYLEKTPQGVNISSTDRNVSPSPARSTKYGINISPAITKPNPLVTLAVSRKHTFGHHTPEADSVNRQKASESPGGRNEHLKSWMDYITQPVTRQTTSEESSAHYVFSANKREPRELDLDQLAQMRPVQAKSRNQHSDRVDSIMMKYMTEKD